MISSRGEWGLLCVCVRMCVCFDVSVLRDCDCVCVCVCRRAKIAALEPAVKERYKEERIEKEARLAEMEASKASNMIEHAADIHSRPAREWFMTQKQKQELKDATKLAVTVRIS